MKRLGWGVLAFIMIVTFSVPARAIDTVATTPNKVNGPFLITGYSFSGPGLRYVQLFNSSSTVASLDGWKITSTTKATPAVTSSYVTLGGLLEPGKHVFAAIPGIIDRHDFTLSVQTAEAAPLVGNVSLVAPVSSGFNDETVSVPTISASTIKEVDVSATNYYLKRDSSTSTGNYVSGFTFMLPGEKLKNDTLYAPPSGVPLQITELYPDASACPPFEASALCNDYVKVQNVSTIPIDVSAYRVRTGTSGQSATATNTKLLHGIILPGEFISFPITLSSTGNWAWLEDAYGYVRYEQSLVEYPSSSGHEKEAWAYDTALGSWRWTNLPTPGNTPSTFPLVPPVNTCTGLTLSEIAANVATEDQFIEVYNATNGPLELGGCVIQTNRSATTSFLFSDQVLQTGQHLSVYIKDTKLTLTKTTTGTVYLLSSDLMNEQDSVTYAELKESTSWASVNGTWTQTYQLTPGHSNVWMEYPECDAGYYRNPDTGNCNKMAATGSTLADCGVGKYRSPDTNRCRSLEALATALTPCDAGQYRNPETNRCRSLVSTASTLVPCATNQERNPETNRCRLIGSSDDLKPCTASQERNPDTNRCRNKISSTATTDFPIETVAQTGEATLGWWAFGGVGMLAAGYAGWEWRREVVAWVRKVIPFGIGRS